MSLEDPFFVVKDDVVKAVAKTRTLYQRWCELQENPSISTKEEQDWTTTELRNGLRSIEWDLEDLEETIGIVEGNPKKFKIDETEINNRRTFIEKTRQEVEYMRDRVLDSRAKKIKQGIMNARQTTAKYTRLQNEIDSPTERFIEANQHQQQLVIDCQDEKLEAIQGSVGTLKTISKQIGNEVDEQAVMLDDLGHEMDNTESKLDSTLKKMAKVLHMSNDRRQWIAIGVLSTIMLIVLALFFVLQSS